MVSRYRLGAIFALIILVSLVAAYEVLWIRPPNSTLTAGTTTVDVCNTKMTYNGTIFCSLDVTSFTTLRVPGYASMNRFVEFMGVLFQMNCPYGYDGCPNPGTVEVMDMGVVSMSVTFADGTNETLSFPYTAGISFPVLSKHSNPAAGFEIVGPFDSMELLLLVQAG